MTQVTLSTKFQVLIPREIRRKARLSQGQKFAVLCKGGVIRLIPLRPLEGLKGALKGMNARIIRDRTS